MFKVLGVESRLRIIELLKNQGPLCVNDLAEALGISPSAVSQHLKVLRLSGLVSNERNGYFIPYDVNAPELEKCCEFLQDVCTCDCFESRHHSRRETGQPKDRITMLREYEKELREELERVQKKINALKDEE
jgi:ArsR family transcriptional regulator